MKIMLNLEIITADMMGREYPLELELEDSRGAKTIDIILVKIGVKPSLSNSTETTQRTN